jgi:hypothetical protein
LGKKEVSAQSRQAAKGFFLFASAPLHDKQKKIRVKSACSRPTYRRQGGCKGFNLFAPLGKKEVSAQSRQAAKSFFFAPLRLCSPNKK